MTVSGTHLVHLLHDHQLRVFTSADVKTLSRLEADAAAHALKRLEDQGLVLRIKRGVWASGLAPDLHPFEAVPYLTAPWPGYVSLYSALADHGIVAETPHLLYAVSSAPPRKYGTPLGDFRIHHLPEHLMWGYEMRTTRFGSFPMAEPEKAFLDTVYLALIPRSPIQLPHRRGRRWKLDRRKIREYAVRFRYPPMTEYLRRWEKGVE